MKRLLTVFIVLWLAQAVAFAAGATLNCKGTVVDEEGEPVIGAGVVITNGRALATTDLDGRVFTEEDIGEHTVTVTWNGLTATYKINVTAAE